MSYYAGIALVKHPKYDDSAQFHDENYSAPRTEKELPPENDVQLPPPATAGLNSEGPPSEFLFLERTFVGALDGRFRARALSRAMLAGRLAP
jgi:hypothetical protein